MQSISHNRQVPDLYTAEQAASELGITSARVYQLATKHNAGLRFGRALLFTRADIEALRGRDTKPGPKPKSRD